MKEKTLKKCIICALAACLIALWDFGYVFAEGEDPGADNNLYINVNADYGRAADVVARVNAERRSRGLASLVPDQTLMDAAMIRAAEIVLYFEHARPNGYSWHSVDPKVSGENLGRGSSSTSRLMELWMDSPGHRENILRSGFSSIGVAVIEYEGTYYWVQLFGYSAGSGAEYPDSGPAQVPLDLPRAEEGGEFALDYEIRVNGTAIGAGARTSIEKGKSAELGLWGYPLTFDASHLRWELSNAELANIDEAATLTAIKGGLATLTAYSGEIERARIEIDTRMDIRRLPVLESFPSPKVLSKAGPLREGVDYVATKSPVQDTAKLMTQIRGINEYKGIINPVN